MPRFAANLTMLFNEVDFTQRFGAAARAGFRGVEYLFPYAYERNRLADLLKQYGLTQVLFNLPAGDWAAGERGIACLPERTGEFRDGVGKAVEYATILGCRRLNCLAGVAPAGLSAARAHAAFVANVAFAADELGRHGIRLLIEPINTRDIPGYFLNRQDDAHAVREEVGAANLKVQLDLYHCQIVEGDLAMKIRKYLPHVGHMQLAGVPERHEPSLGEVNYPYLFALVDDLRYDGWIGCEYRPKAGTSAGLGWFAPYR